MSYCDGAGYLNICDIFKLNREVLEVYLDKFGIWMRFSIENSVGRNMFSLILIIKNSKNIPAKLRVFIGDNKITYHKLAPQKTVYVSTGPLSCHFGIAYRKEARIVVDGALKAEVREPPGPVRALHLTSDLVVGE